MKHKAPILVLALSLLVCAGCSLFEPSFEPFTSAPIEPPPPQTAVATTAAEPKPLTEVAVESLPSRNQDKADSISIRWQKPESPVDGYIIRYGFAPTELDYEERLKWEQIKSDVDTKHGAVLVHEIQGLPNDKIVYLSLAATKDDQTSRATAIFSVHPVKK